jgi:hypothetical protein
VVILIMIIIAYDILNLVDRKCTREAKLFVGQRFVETRKPESKHALYYIDENVVQ